MTANEIVKVLIVDDHPIVLSGCRGLLSSQAGVEMLEAATGAEGYDLYMSERPNVIVVDINLPDMSGLDLTRRIIAEDPSARVLIFSMNDDPVFVAEALKCNAKGYVSKNGDPNAIYEAIMQVAAGEIWLPARMAEKLAFMNQSNSEATFAGREIEILRLLANGKTMSEVAVAIGVSYKTTANICTTLRERLGARTAIEMITIALERKII
ncbi:MAG: response regulator transcription factor [Hyphomicrobiaceae bacterium]